MLELFNGGIVFAMEEPLIDNRWCCSVLRTLCTARKVFHD